MELRGYQLTANREVWVNLAQDIPTLLQSPTGAGKTAMFTHIAKMLLDHRRQSSIAVAHRREIVKQMAEKMELAGMIPEVVMAGHALNPWANVTVASKGTLAARLKRGTSAKLADLLIVDEGHLVGKGGEYERMIGKHTEAGGKLLLTTATPIRGDGYGLGNICKSMVRTPDVPWLIEHGYLCRPDHHICHVPSTVGLGGDGSEFNRARVEATMNTKELVGDVVDNWLRFGTERPSLIFASGVEHSKAIVERIRAAGYRAEHVDGNTPKEERDSIYERSQSGEIQAISNDSIYIEGTDLPWIAYVAFAFISKSLRKLMQAGGRAMRTHHSKQNAFIADHGGNIYRLGRLDIARDWELSTDDKMQERMEAERKKNEALSLTCPACGLVHSCKVCPKCAASPKEAIDKDYIKAVLEKMTVFEWEAYRPKPAKKVSKDEKQEFYSSLLGMAFERPKYRPGWAGNQFKARFGVFPRGLVDHPMTPSPAVRRFVAEKRNEFFNQQRAAVKTEATV